MTTTDPRSRSNDAITMKLVDLLREVIARPELFSQRRSLRSALATQPGIAAYKDEERRLKARSYSTLARSAERCHPGGIVAFEQLRLEAAKALGVETRGERRKFRHDEREETIKILQAELRYARQDLWHVSAVLTRCMQQSRTYAAKGGDRALMKLCEREQAELNAALSLLQSRKNEDS